VEDLTIGGVEKFSKKREEVERRRDKKEEEDLLRVQTQSCTLQPLRMQRTHTARGSMRVLMSAMYGTKNSNASAIAYKATNH